MTLHPIVAITGPPGVGKTTMINKLVANLHKEHPDYKVDGFYTAETRNSGTRTGFEIITLSGQKATLALKSGSGMPKVGAYSVNVPAFESLVLPMFQQAYGPKNVLVIDEVGKMELLSGQFSDGVRGWLHTPPCPVVVTIPVASGRGKPISLVEEIRSKANAVITLSVSQRGPNNDASVICELKRHIFSP